MITGNEKILTTAPGIGKKIAQRIILELKDKVSKEQGTVNGMTVSHMPTASDGKISEAAAALAVLGYSQQDISTALHGIDIEGLSLEEIVRAGLKRMVK